MNAALKGVWRTNLRYPNKIVMIFNRKCVHCFKKNGLVEKQKEKKKKKYFLKVIGKE